MGAGATRDVLVQLGMQNSNVVILTRPQDDAVTKQHLPLIQQSATGGQTK
jgi:hypothetical protein